MKDLIIIGAGPAGLSAAIYGIRAGLDLLMIERFSPGGQVMNTHEVENYPGFVDPVKGWELMSAMENQARRLGAEIINGEAGAIIKDKEKNVFSISLSNGKSLIARSVILACGSANQKLNIPGEQEFTGKGVSYCATCDGAFFKDKVTAVIGGGNTALEEALFLTRFASKVYLVHRRYEFRGEKILQQRILANNKIEPIYDTIITSIEGKEKVTKAILKNKSTNEKKDLLLDGVFIFVGYSPNTAFLPEELLNTRKEVIIDKNLQTKIHGIFAAGDMRENSKRQIVMAAADGATAAMNAYDYLQEMG
ncbi:MAG: thioredoxin-disulfide reductase [Spirochaetes bacterium]|nr:thioredoxin-disulfide reductase [Spirochaetota bacterium]